MTPQEKSSQIVKSIASSPAKRRSIITICSAKNSPAISVSPSPMNVNPPILPTDTNPIPAKHTAAAAKRNTEGRRRVIDHIMNGVITQ